MIDGPLIEDVTETAVQQLQSLVRDTATDHQSARPVDLEHRAVDLEEKQKVDDFTSKGCGCHLVNNGPCSSQFSREHFEPMRASSAEMSWDQLNMVVMGQVREG